MQQFWKNERVRTLSLNVLIGVLLIGIFLQCGVFLYRYSKIRAADGEIPFNMRMLSVSGQDDGGALNPDLLLPAEIAVSREGSARAVLNSAAVMRDLYEEMAGTITACLAASPAKGTDALWALTVTSM